MLIILSTSKLFSKSHGKHFLIAKTMFYSFKMPSGISGAITAFYLLLFMMKVEILRVIAGFLKTV